MGAPSSFRDVPLMMRREVAQFSHKAKRVLLCYPGKPRWGIWLKWKQAVLRTDHHILPLLVILDSRDDMNRLAGRFGDRTRAGSRGRRLECPLARFVLRSRSRPLWRMRLRLQQEGEISHLLLQNADLSLQGGKLSGNASSSTGNGGTSQGTGTGGTSGREVRRR